MSLRIAGYAALFDIADGARDTILRGAFARTLDELRRGHRAPLPLFWQHDGRQRIGTADHLAEDERGLQVIARIERRGSRAVQHLLHKTATGLSFGYHARRYRRLPEGRLLQDIELLEISLVTHPLQHGARVHLVQ